MTELQTKRFWATYERLAEIGACDGPGGAEYHRVRAEWVEAGCPDDIERHIRARANL